MPEDNRAIAITKEYFGYCPACSRLTQWDSADLKDGVFVECSGCRWLFLVDSTQGAEPLGIPGSNGKGA